MVSVRCTFGEDDFFWDSKTDISLEDKYLYTQEWTDDGNPQRHWYLTEVKGYRNSLPPKEVMGILEYWFVWAQDSNYIDRSI